MKKTSLYFPSFMILLAFFVACRVTQPKTIFPATALPVPGDSVILTTKGARIAFFVYPWDVAGERIIVSTEGYILHIGTARFALPFQEPEPQPGEGSPHFASSWKATGGLHYLAWRVFPLQTPPLGEAEMTQPGYVEFVRGKLWIVQNHRIYLQRR